MTTDDDPATEATPNPAEVCAALIAQSNSLVMGGNAGLQQGLCLIAAGLFAVAAAIRDRPS